MQGNTGSGVWADSAYRSEAMEEKLRARKLRSHVHRKGTRNKPLTRQAKGSNKTKSSVRVRVEHIFGAQTNDMGGTLVRTIGIVRAKAKIGMKNIAYNMRRLGQLQRLNPNPAWQKGPESRALRHKTEFRHRIPQTLSASKRRKAKSRQISGSNQCHPREKISKNRGDTRGHMP